MLLRENESIKLMEGDGKQRAWMKETEEEGWLKGREETDGVIDRWKRVYVLQGCSVFATSTGQIGATWINYQEIKRVEKKIMN